MSSRTIRYWGRRAKRNPRASEHRRRQTRQRIHRELARRGLWAILPGDSFADWVGPLVEAFGYRYHDGADE